MNRLVDMTPGCQPVEAAHNTQVTALTKRIEELEKRIGLEIATIDMCQKSGSSGSKLDGIASRLRAVLKPENKDETQ